jgi:hypothetical protein
MASGGEERLHAARVARTIKTQSCFTFERVADVKDSVSASGGRQEPT